MYILPLIPNKRKVPPYMPNGWLNSYDFIIHFVDLPIYKASSGIIIYRKGYSHL